MNTEACAALQTRGQGTSALFIRMPSHGVIEAEEEEEARAEGGRHLLSACSPLALCLLLEIVLIIISDL